MRQMNVRQVTITMRTGAVLSGKIDIGSFRRLSDFLTTDGSPFIELFEAAPGENDDKGVRFLRRSGILSVEEDESQDQL